MLKDRLLARKWRPKSFEEVVGQSHALSMLRYMLGKGSLHPALLFSGMHGVGKTTLARLVAKGLNCQEGPTADFCQHCQHCRAIDRGEHVDVVEVDAASKAKVEETREWIENLPYAPMMAKYKVYILDEVHMLSRHSFNALLKVLEEPPEHIQFLLATTEPHKIPETVRSRLMPVVLAPVSEEAMGAYLRRVLEQEGYPYEEEACVALIARAGGSLREALTLMMQALAHAQGGLKLASVRALLGEEAGEAAENLLEALRAGKLEAMLSTFEGWSEGLEPADRLLAAMAALLHQSALSQVGLSHGGALIPLPIEKLFQAYRMLLLARKELPYAPTPGIGLEMVGLRLMHHFHGNRLGAGRSASGAASAWPQGASKEGPAEKAVEHAISEVPREEEAALSPGEERSSRDQQAEQLPELSQEMEGYLQLLGPGAQAKGGSKLLRLPLGGLAKQLVWNSLPSLIEKGPEASLQFELEPSHASWMTASVRAQIERLWAHHYQQTVRLEVIRVDHLSAPCFRGYLEAKRAEASSSFQGRVEKSAWAKALKAAPWSALPNYLEPH